MKVVTMALTPEEKQGLFDYEFENNEMAFGINGKKLSKSDFVEEFEKCVFNLQKNVITTSSGKSKTIITYSHIVGLSTKRETITIYENEKEVLKEIGKNRTIIHFVPCVYLFEDGEFTDITDDTTIDIDEEEKQESPVDLILNKHHELQPQQFTKWLITNSYKLKQMENNTND